MRAETRIALAAAALAVLLALGACEKKASETEAAAVTPTTVKLTSAQRAHVRLYTVADGTFGRTVEAPGVVDFDNDHSTSVLAPFSGPVTRILVEAGQRVGKGQPLALVASPDFSAAVGAYAKALASAKNLRKLADTDQDLLKHNAISAKEAMQAESDAVGAESDRDAALQALKALDIDGGSLRAVQEGRPVTRVEGVIRAPMAGTVAEKLITPGQLLQAGTTPCFTVAELSRMWVMAQAPESDLGSIAVGDSAAIEGSAAPGVLAGTVGNIGAVVNPDTRAVLVRVVAPNPGGVLKKQMYVRVQIHSRRQSQGLLVPVGAVLRDDENLPFVFVEQRDGSFARRRVDLGQRSGDVYAINGGLAAGERIVDDGGLFLQFMQSQ